jgi:hypothetical protein
VLCSTFDNGDLAIRAHVVAGSLSKAGQSKENCSGTEHFVLRVDEREWRVLQQLPRVSPHIYARSLHPGSSHVGQQTPLPSLRNMHERIEFAGSSTGIGQV